MPTPQNNIAEQEALLNEKSEVKIDIEHLKLEDGKTESKRKLFLLEEVNACIKELNRIKYNLPSQKNLRQQLFFYNLGMHLAFFAFMANGTIVSASIMISLIRKAQQEMIPSLIQKLSSLSEDLN